MTVSKAQVIEKRWGWEHIIYNGNEYCGKVLEFRRIGDCISMQYHMKKQESWYVTSGEFDFYWIHPRTGKRHHEILKIGDTVTNFPGDTHQVVARKPFSKIFEVSTRHYDEDTYRIYMKTPNELLENE